MSWTRFNKSRSLEAQAPCPCSWGTQAQMPPGLCDCGAGWLGVGWTTWGSSGASQEVPSVGIRLVLVLLRTKFSIKRMGHPIFQNFYFKFGRQREVNDPPQWLQQLKLGQAEARGPNAVRPLHVAGRNPIVGSTLAGHWSPKLKLGVEPRPLRVVPERLD